MRNPNLLHRVRRMLFVAGVAAVACVHAAGAQTVRGLVIGIDDYAHLKDLEGAVNDARDIEQALGQVGVDDLEVLENEEATRKNIEAEWQALMDRARRGDTLVLTYAGHGGQAKERVPGSEQDGMDEVLVLGGFSSEDEGTGERIIDDEIHQGFLDAGRKGLRVIFVSDSCHSGTLTRSVDRRAPAQTSRYAGYIGELTDDQLEPDLPQGTADTAETWTDDLAHVSFLAGSQDNQTVPEIRMLDGSGEWRPRGALSYTFARAVRGEAGDGDGVLRRRDLWRFVIENVRKLAGSKQTPNLLPSASGDEGDEVLLRTTSTEPAAAAGTSAAPGIAPLRVRSAAPGITRLRVLDAGPEVLAALRERLPDVRMVSDEEPPDLVWDAGRGEVITALGDVAAYEVEDVDALSGVIRKWEAVRAIKDLSARNSLRLRVEPHDGLHRRGARIAVRVEGMEGRWLTVFNLAGNGVVHHLHPGPSDHPTVAADVPFRFEADVIHPFGADHVVAVSADSPLDALNDRLMRLDGSKAATELAGVLAEARGWSLGIQGLYTAP